MSFLSGHMRVCLLSALGVALVSCSGRENAAPHAHVYRAQVAAPLPEPEPAPIPHAFPAGPPPPVPEPQAAISSAALPVPPRSNLPRGGGKAKLGKPYRVGDNWYVPADEPDYDRTGIASWYGPDFHGKRTANGEIFDMRAVSAAHPTLPLPSYVYVTNLANGRTLLVRVNDRGPYVAGRIIDLSHGAAGLLGTQARGVGQVRVRYAGPAPLDGNDDAERAHLATQPWFAARVSAAD